MGSDLYMAGRFRAETQYGPACALLRRVQKVLANCYGPEPVDERGVDRTLVADIDAFLKLQEGPP